MVTTFARVARASVLGVVAVSMASAAHLLAGGVVPSAEALALVVGGVAATSAPLLGVRASARRIVALVVAQQIVLHIVFAYAAVVSGRMTMGPGVISMSGMHMRHMGGPMSLSTGPAASWQMLGAHLMGDLATPGGAAMTGAHLAAAAAVGWWLANGERQFWSLVVMLAAADAAARMRGAAARLAVVRARAGERELWDSARLRQRSGRWSIRTWEPLSSVELRGPPARERLAYA